MVKQSILVATLVAALGLQACAKQVDQAKVEADVQKAQAEGQKKIVDAQAKLEQVNAENNKDIVSAQADARVDAAKAADNAAPAASAADAKTAKTPGARAVAAKPADAAAPTPPVNDENVAKTRIAALGKVADAQYDVEKAKAEAAYDVTMARCDGQTSDNMQAVCRDGAKATLDKAVATAKARKDAAHRRASMAQNG